MSKKMIMERTTTIIIKKQKEKEKETTKNIKSNKQIKGTPYVS